MNRPPPAGQWRSTRAQPVANAKGAANPNLHPLLVLILVGSAALYNTLLALFAARGLSLGESHVIAAEFLVLAATGAMVLAAGRREDDSIPLLFLAFFVISSLIVSIASQTLQPNMARNAAIAALFLMLGLRGGAPAVRLCFAAVAAFVAAGLMLEIVDSGAYVDLFQPAQYYQLTRGAEPLEFVGGLFRNASGFEGRFSIARIIDHRASSIFLEPVSLGNFGVVLLGFLTCFWTRLRWIERLVYAALAVLILLTTNSRILLSFFVICPFIYLVAPKVSGPRRLLILPMIMTVAVIVYLAGASIYEDNLTGRIGKAVHNVTELGVAGMLGAGPNEGADLTDSGFAFVIASSSIFGLIALWLFTSLIVRDEDSLQRRAALFLCLFVGLSLSISGTSVFSIKVAALLWMLIGAAKAMAPLEQAPAAAAGKLRPQRWPANPRVKSA